MYDIILSDDDTFKDILNTYLNESSEPIHFLPAFNKINIFIGANNSGKSRFMRFLMSKKDFKGVKNLQEFETMVVSYNNKIRVFNDSIIDSYIDRSRNGYRYNQSQLQDFQRNRLGQLEAKTFSDQEVLNNREKLKALQHYRDQNGLMVTDDYIMNFSLDGVLTNFKAQNTYYIPTLRTAHSLFDYVDDRFKKIDEDIYEKTVNKNYKLDSHDVQVFTGIHLHKEILNTRNAKRSVRESFESFEKFIGDYFFRGKRIDIVAEFNKDDNRKGYSHSEIISVHIEGEKDTRDLHDLGDGVQAIIILMYKIFTAEPNSFIFIDEPELNLHPGMQRLFLEQIDSNEILKKKNLTYVIVTHSNHFLDLTIEKDNVSIYSFSPKEISGNGNKEFVIKNVNNGDNSILKTLGVNNSSVFLANCSIWVEGISDRNYIKAFLKSYLKHINSTNQNKTVLKEDIDYAFFEYAGSNIDHYIFEKNLDQDLVDGVYRDINALALNNKIFLLADSDKPAENSAKATRLTNLESISNDNLKVEILWDIREIENIFHNEIWKQVLPYFFNKSLMKTQQAVIETKLETALSAIDSKDYQSDYIGVFLNEVDVQMGKIGKQNILNTSSWEIKSDGSHGTFLLKRDLGEAVLEQDFDWSVFSKNKLIVRLTENIFKFITGQ